MNPTQNQAQNPVPPVDITPADTLRGAVCYLELYGWIQGNPFGPTPYGSPFPPSCVLGAITLAVFGHPTDPEGQHDRESVELYNRAVCCLANFLWTDGRAAELNYEPGSGQSNTELVTDWNDETGQTLADITAVLRAAADEYDWAHATEDDLETYAENEYDHDRHPTRKGFLAWRAAR